MPSSFPERPWSRIAMDLFELNNKMYILVVDYFSRWIELRRLGNQTSKETVEKVKSIFAVHGIPDVVMSDNGSQFASFEFKDFAKHYGFTHAMSSPRFPQSNGEAERAVRTVKGLLQKAKDPYMALLKYRTTPLQNGYTPSALLMGRKLNTNISVIPSALSPKIPDLQKVRNRETAMKEKQCDSYNSRHRTRPPLNLL